MSYVHIVHWRNYNNDDDDNVFQKLFQRARFFVQLSAVVDILRYCHTCTVYSKPRLNVVCQPFKTDFRTCKQLDFDASSYPDRSVLHTIIVNRL